MPDHMQPHGLRKNLPGAAAFDRRNTERFPFSAVAEITEVSSKSKVPVRIGDIGRQGCYADSLNVFPVGTRVQLCVRHGGAVIEVFATVTYSLAGMGMGLNFEQMPREMRATLSRWLAEAKGEAVPPESSAASDWEEPAPSPERRALLNLIKLMVRKGLLSDSECKDLLEEITNL